MREIMDVHKRYLTGLCDHNLTLHSLINQHKNQAMNDHRMSIVMGSAWSFFILHMVTIDKPPRFDTNKTPKQ